ncbi:MAG: glucose-1-phosphate adenylyltransferase [Oscillospiraceae bacterium]|nr:glucose-1-phosphate adenylyltransferase [Oscillospiraceae bacterium]
MDIQKKCVAMLLAGGQGSRLYALTAKRAKPAVPFGGKYKIIDFPLSNCIHSGIDTVGVLTQYEPTELNAYIGTGASWDLDCINGGAFVLPPYVKGKKGEWFSGTANAIYQHLPFIDEYAPQYLLVLSGDHIYKMDYSDMIDFHEKTGADGTIAVIEVPIEEASRFGIMNTDPGNRIVAFEEKPVFPKNNMASMGIYVFNYPKLREYLIRDHTDPDSDNDFGKNIIPKMLQNGEKLYAYLFQGYWKDVGTVESLWEAHMELLRDESLLALYSDDWRIYAKNPTYPPHYLTEKARVTQSIIGDGCYIAGRVENSVIFPGVRIEEGSYVKDSVVMGETTIRENASVVRAILDEQTVIGASASVGSAERITVIGKQLTVDEATVIEAGTVLYPEMIR